MKILVTGCAGFIGTNLCKRLMQLGHEVVGIDNFSYGHTENMKDIGFENYYATDVRYFQGEIKDVDVIYHQANLRKNISSKKPEEDIDITIKGTCNLLQYAIKSGVKKFIYASSSLAYGDSDPIVTEESPLRPICIYGISKIAAEKLVRYYHGTNGLETTIFRYFQGYGYYQDAYRGAAIIPTVIRNMFENEPIIIYGDGTQTRSFTWIEDIIDILMMPLFDSAMSGETYNVTAGREYTIMDTIDLIVDCYCELYPEKKVNRTDRLCYRAALSDDIKHLKGSNDKIRNLGITFNTDIKENIKKTIKFYERYNTQSL